MLPSRLSNLLILSLAIFVWGTVLPGGSANYRLSASETETSANKTSETTELILAPELKPESEPEPESGPESEPEPEPEPEPESADISNNGEKSEEPTDAANSDNLALPQSFDEIDAATPSTAETKETEEIKEAKETDKTEPAPPATPEPETTYPKPDSVKPIIESKRPNIIILTADDLGVGDVSCYYSQDIKTPNIDQIARNGLRLGWFCTPISDDQAAQRAALTGTRFSKQIENHNLGFAAQQNGYRSCFLGQWLLGATDNQLPLTVGFDSFWGITVSPDQSPFHPIAGNSLSVQKLYENETIIGYNPNLACFTDELADRAIRFISESQTSAEPQTDTSSSPKSVIQPFFLHVAFTAPHVPLLFDPQSTTPPKPQQEQTGPSRGVYGQVVEQLDAAVGRILTALNETGLNDQTLVVFLSDNGPWLSYGSHAGSPGPLREGKGTCWEGGVRVPCVLQWPNVIPKKSDYNHFTTTLDLSLAIAQLLSGQTVPALGQPTDENYSPEAFPKPTCFPRAEGVSLLPALTGQYSSALDSRPFVYYLPSGEIAAVRVGNWKIVRPHAYPAWDTANANPIPGLPGPYRIAKTGWEAYSLKSAASSETQNEAEEQAKLVEAVRKALKE